MDREKENIKQQRTIRVSWPVCCDTPTIPKASDAGDDTKIITRKRGGWKSMPYILGNETFERLATVGLLANFMVYLLNKFHMDQVRANNVLNIWSGATNFAPLVGAYISDSYAGRFRTIAFSSFFSLLGMVTVTLTAWLPQLHPPPCSHKEQCSGPTSSQMGFLITGLGLLSIGTGGIRPCSLPFGVDQFDPTSDEGRRGINSFYNWYYTTFTVILIVALTVVVYIQDSVSWVLGFGLPTACMCGSILLFFSGSRLYVHVKPEGSVFTGLAQAVVAWFRKRRLDIPDEHGAFYDPPLKASVMTKLPLTQQYRFMNKAAIVIAGDLNPDGTPANPWRLCSIQTIEELKCIIRIVPIWASGIICFTAMAQQGTFTVSQALKMDRHLGPNFQIPAGSLSVISMLAIGLWVPFYDRVVVPGLRTVTHLESGITLLQRMGIGMGISILSMAVAGIVEHWRRSSSAAAAAPMSVLWLAPQLVLMGLAEAFNIIGQIEFFNRQFPEHMTSVGNALFFCTVAGANYLSSVLVTVVHGVTGKNGRPDWLTNDLNRGRLDCFYYLVAALGVLNFGYFLVCATRYRYKEGSVRFVDEKSEFDVELSSSVKQ